MVLCVCVQASCSFSVTVLDEQVPEITCPTNIVDALAVDKSSKVQSWTVAANDNVGLAGPAVCVPASGSVFAAGTTQVSCTVQDTSGKQSQCGFSVTVNDQQAPGQSVYMAVCCCRCAVRVVVARYTHG